MGGEGGYSLGGVSGTTGSGSVLGTTTSGSTKPAFVSTIRVHDSASPGIIRILCNYNSQGFNKNQVIGIVQVQRSSGKL